MSKTYINVKYEKIKFSNHQQYDIHRKKYTIEYWPSPKNAHFSMQK